MSETATDIAEKAPESNSRPLLTALPGSWPWAVAFMLSLSALGLSFYPALIVIIFIMAHSYTRNRYDFTIQLTLVLGGFAILTPEVTVVNTAFIVFALGVVFALLLRKNAVFKRVVVAWCLYTALLLFLAITSEETMRVQLRPMIYYTLFIYFTVPIAIFAGKEFRYSDFVRAVLPYALLLAIFYILDACVLSGWVLIPNSHNWSGADSTFYSLRCWPLSGAIIRKYPPGLYLLTLLVFPIAHRQYRIKYWQWAVFIAALLFTRTFTVISGFVIIFLVYQSSFKKIFKYAAVGVPALVLLYFVDGTMAYRNDDGVEQSPLRIHSSVNQILDLSEAVDDEDLAEFGSGRIGQALPKLELLYNLGYQWRGFGFLDKARTDNPKFIIENEYYRDQSESIEVATDIEITALQALITIGYIGLFVHILFFVYTWWVVRKFSNSGYYLAELLLFCWFGLGGFEGLIYPMGLILAALSFSVVFLSNKTDTRNHASQ